MTADRQFDFGPFRFDARTGELWRDGVEARLTPRATAVLTMLAARAGQLVTKQELFDQVAHEKVIKFLEENAKIETVAAAK